MIAAAPQQEDLEMRFLEPFEDKIGTSDRMGGFFSDDIDGGKFADDFELFR
jgi:hypothetical protein